MSRTLDYHPDIDGFRAVAVSAVVLFHLALPGVGGGFIGVDVFFVISGYLITLIIRKQVADGSFSFSSFYIRRIRRLLPALLFTVAISFVCGFLLLSPAALAAFSRSALYAVVSISNFGFWLDTGYFDSEKITKPLLHTWSLGVEEQFYLVWPFLAVLLFKVRSERVQILACSLFVAVGFAVCVYATWSAPSAAFFLSPFRAWQFGAGGLLAIVTQLPNYSQLSRRWGNHFSLVGLGILAASFVSVSDDGYPGYQSLAPTLGTVFLLSGAGSAISMALLGNQVASWLGRISYSIYLVHWPVIVYYYYVVNSRPDIWGYAVVLSIIAILSLVSFYAVEEPLRRSRADRSAVPAGAVLASVAALALLLNFVGAHVWAQNGWPWRVDADARARAAMASRRFDCPIRDIPEFGRSCRIGQANMPPSFAVVGDSHAEALLPGIDQVLKEQKKAGIAYIQRATLPFVGVRSVDGSTTRPNNFDSVYQRLAKSKVSDVIIHARFSLHWLTWRPPNEEMERKFVVRNEGDPLTVEKSQRNFVDGLIKTIRLLRDAGKNVYIIGAIPHQGVDLTKCLARPTYLFSAGFIVRTCGGLTREESLNRAAAVNAVLAETTKDLQASFFDPAAFLCAAQSNVCRRTMDGKLLYRDDDHLSIFGARYVASQWRQIVFQPRGKLNRSELGSALGNGT
jgi:peptidoglycan/LPS O-acetylase OafA/YrhL